MRDILFKAKRLGNGEWVEGFLFVRKNTLNETIECFVLVDAYEQITDGQRYVRSNLNQECFRVIPDTICQYTGLTDKNGNKIWENDIFKHYNKRDVLDYKYYEIGVVKWDKTKCRYINYRAETKETFNLNMMCDYEVIGNIFDNA